MVPPVAPPATAAAPAAPAAAPGGPVGPAAPVAPKKPMSKGLLIGLIAGGAAIVIIAIIAVVALVLPAILGGGSSTATTVIDINSEPEATWDYDITGGNDEDLVDASSTLSSVHAVGDSQVLISPAFDSSNYSAGDEGWYEGYDDDYDAGYESGEQYNVDYEAWYTDDNSTYDTYPEYDDYYTDDSVGFSDGFYDAIDENGEGASRLEEPVDPDFTPSLSLLDLNSGKEVWSVDLSDVSDDVSFDSQVSASDVEGSNAVIVSISTLNDDDEQVTVIATLDKANGKVISSVSDERTYLVGTYDGDVILAVANKDRDKADFGRYSVNGLDDDPKWETDAKIDGAPYVNGDYVFISSEKGGVTLDARNGEEAKFGDDLDEASYFFIGGQLIRSEYKDDGYEIEGYNLEGKSVWEDSVEADALFESGGSLFVADAGDSYSELMRINPSNGSEMWDDSYGEDFSGSPSVVGNSVIVRSDDYEDVLILDLGNGEEKAKEGVDEDSGIILGDSQFYEVSSDKLTAYGYDGEGDRWKFKLDEDSETVRQVGRHLVLLDRDKLTINGLAAK